GKSMRGLTATLARHGMEDRFVTLQTADFGPGKPHPAMLERAMGDCGAAPAETVMIGDTSFDIEMGLSAGAYAVGVGWGYHPAEELTAAGAHHMAEDCDALEAAVASLFAENG
ncbi:MAG: HAD-IA family hydrolase, partial [Alphaproteobacteria bacterium]